MNVEWATANETNNKNFCIERSLDAEEFSTIAIQSGAGNSTALHRYVYTDQTVEKGNTYYYRIKQVDENGQYTYSKIQTISISASGNIIAFPNPFEESITIQFPPQDLGASVILTDLLGQQLQSYMLDALQVQAGAGLPKGIYLLNVTSNKKTQVLKLIKE